MKLQLKIQRLWEYLILGLIIDSVFISYLEKVFLVEARQANIHLYSGDRNHDIMCVDLSAY